MILRINGQFQSELPIFRNDSYKTEDERVLYTMGPVKIMRKIVCRLRLSEVSQR